MSDLWDDLSNFAGDTADLLYDGAVGDYHAAAAGVDWALGDTAGMNAHLTEVNQAIVNTEADFDQGVEDLTKVFNDVGIL